MPWVEATLRGQRVLARVRGDGSLASEGGRVEIRYNPNSGRAYRAGARNLQVLDGAKVYPDDACAPAEPAVEKSGTASRAIGDEAREAKRSGPSLSHGSSRASLERDEARETNEAPRGRKVAAHAPPHDAWIAYTDGACSGNPGPAGSGVVLVAPGGKMHEGLEYLGEATNNVAELTAILRALEWAPADARGVVVHTDSQYAIGVLQKGWKAKANVELVERTKRAVQARGARLVYVPGHQGVPLNERADELAREAIATRSTRAVRAP
jgi:ribonuclease HI